MDLKSACTLLCLLKLLTVEAIPLPFETFKALQTFHEKQLLPEANSVFIGRYPRENHVSAVPSNNFESRNLPQNFEENTGQLNLESESGFGIPLEDSVIDLPNVIDQPIDTFPAFVITQPATEEVIETEPDIIGIVEEPNYREAVVTSHVSFDRFPNTRQNVNNQPIGVPVKDNNFEFSRNLNSFTSIGQLPLQNEPRGEQNIIFPNDIRDPVHQSDQIANEIDGDSFRPSYLGRSLENFNGDLQGRSSNPQVYAFNSGTFTPGELQGGFRPCSGSCITGR